MAERVTQVVVEWLALPSSTARVTQVVLEVLYVFPTPVPIFITTQENTPIAFVVTAPCFSSPVYSTVTAPTHGAITGTYPNLVYTPNINYVGPDTLVYGGVCSGALVTNTVFITVSPINSGPGCTSASTVR